MGISRRNFLSGSGAAMVLSGSTMGLAACTPDFQRNVIMIYVDDLRDWVGYLDSHPGVYTPNIDALAAQSYSFDRAFCSVPSCLGSRASTLWGITPPTSGVQTNWVPHYLPLVDSTRRSIPDLFRNAGWTTYNSGKFFHNALPDRWDITRPYPEIGDILNTQTPQFGSTFFDYGPLAAGETHPDQDTTNWFVQQLQNPPEPFFMGVGLYQPHVPWRIPQWALDLHPLNDVVVPQPNCVDDLDDVPPIGVDMANRPFGGGVSNYDKVESSGQKAKLVQAYLAACSHTDAMIGQVMNALASKNFNNDTVVMLISDHGYHLGEKLHWRKSTLWEQATRVPMMISGAPGMPAGVRFPHPVSMLDVAPTSLALAGIAPYAGFEGNSLVGINQSYADDHPAITHWQQNRSLRWQDWRYTRYTDGTEELYHLGTDPQECTNLIGTPNNEAMRAALAAMLDA